MESISNTQRFAWLALLTLALSNSELAEFRREGDRHQAPQQHYGQLLTIELSNSAIAEFRREGDRHLAAHQHYDQHFSHNHAYYDRGYVVREVPRDSYTVVHSNVNFWYSRGEWYRRSGPSWVVVGAP